MQPEAFVNSIAARVGADPQMWADLEGIVACGPRFCGSSSEKAAVAFLAGRLCAIAPGVVREAFPHDGWECRSIALLCDGKRFDAHPLIRSPATSADGVTAEVIDAGRGTREDFAALSPHIRGRIVIARHDYMFSASRIRWALKYQWAQEHGAVGLLLSNSSAEDFVVSGSVGRADEARIPAAGISRKTAEALTGGGSGPRSVTLRMLTARKPHTAENLHLDLRGASEKRVVLSAHIDGHDLGQGAIDNATGLAIVLAIARAIAPDIGDCAAGLRVSLFNAEEWDMVGSEHHLKAMPANERAKAVLNVNVDAPASGSRLTAFTSEFDEVATLVGDLTRRYGMEAGIYAPLLNNSDHAVFARAGIPALRLASGWEEPQSDHRFMLTPGDTLKRISPGRLVAAAKYAATLTAHVCALGRLE